MALIQRYSGIIQGGVILAGNSLTCKNAGTNPPGGDYYNGAYISTNQGLVAQAGFPNGTSFSASDNSSSAVISIPPGSNIIYAQLFWIVTGPVGAPNTAINFTTPVTTTTVSPDLAIRQTYSVYYWQAADVKILIQNGGSGTYVVGNVPGINITNNSSITGNGWGIIIVYENAAYPARYININTGTAATSSGTPSEFTFTGFQAPTSGPIKAYFLVSDVNGDVADKAEIFIGTTSIANATIGNTFNPWNGAAPYAYFQNMLVGNILVADPNNPNIGLIDTRGTFGAYNKDPFTPAAPSYCRVNIDVAGFDISNNISNSQSSLYTKVTFVGSGTSAITSQIVQVDVNSPNISVTKSVDKTTAVPNDVLTYTVVVKNSGTLNADTVMIIDTLPTGTSFMAGSLIVNGVTVAGSPLPPGYVYGALPLNTTATLSFKATVTTVPGVVTTLPNSCYVPYKYTPTTTQISGAETSNIVVTTIPAASFINIYKVVNKAFADLGEYITYTFTIPNTGGADAGNIIFIDTIPNGTTYVSNSFYLNGALIPGANPQGGVSLGTIAAGLASTVSFRVQVYTLPTINPIPNNGGVYYNSYGVTPMSFSSNTVQTKVNIARVAITKFSDKNYADIGTTITYTMSLNNSGNVSAANVLFSDTIPNDTTFVNGSFSINGATIAGSPNPPGVNIGTIPVGITTLSFKVTVNTIPTPNPIPNSAAAAFNYTVDPSIPNGGAGTSNSNIVYTKVNHAQFVSSKTVDKSYVTCSDIIKYTVVITNTGNVSGGNIVFQDTIPNGTEFISNSFTVNGVTIIGANPSTGVSIATIAAGATSTLTFQVVVRC